MTDHPDEALLRLGHDLELLFKAATFSSSATYETRSAISAQTVKVMKAIHRLQPTTIEGVAVKLRALCFDFADFSVKDMDMKHGDVAEVQLGRLMRHVQKLANGRAWG